MIVLKVLPIPVMASRETYINRMILLYEKINFDVAADEADTAGVNGDAGAHHGDRPKEFRDRNDEPDSSRLGSNVQNKWANNEGQSLSPCQQRNPSFPQTDLFPNLNDLVFKRA